MKKGKNLIKEHKADCKTAKHSCAGQNKKGEVDSWIFVPKGMCDKVNEAVKTNKWDGISKSVKDKISG